VDQRQGANIGAGGLAEDEHILQAAWHGGVIGGGRVEAVKPAEEGIADRADHENKKGDERDGIGHLGQALGELGRDGGADGKAENRAHRPAEPAHAAQPDPGERGQEAGGERPEQEGEGQAEQREDGDSRRGDWRGLDPGAVDHGAHGDASGTGKGCLRPGGGFACSRPSPRPVPETERAADGSGFRRGRRLSIVSTGFWPGR
jgi:hypothetical protein